MTHELLSAGCHQTELVPVTGLSQRSEQSHKLEKANSVFCMEFPNPFTSSCSFHSEPIGENTALLHTSEVKIAERFKAEIRRNEFSTGRVCARIALKSAGFPNFPVLRNQDRSPAWPFSVVGSITHGAGYAAAMVANHRSGIMGLGMDLEDLTREIKTNITKHLLTTREIESWMGGQAEVTREVRIIFSIKEAIYKCLYPLAGVYLGFHDAEIEEMSEQGFKGRLLRSPLNREINLPFALQGKLMVTKTTVFSAMAVDISDLNRMLRKS